MFSLLFSLCISGERPGAKPGNTKVSTLSGLASSLSKYHRIVHRRRVPRLNTFTGTIGLFKLALSAEVATTPEALTSKPQRLFERGVPRTSVSFFAENAGKRRARERCVWQRKKSRRGGGSLQSGRKSEACGDLGKTSSWSRPDARIAEAGKHGRKVRGNPRHKPQPFATDENQ